MSTTRSVIGVDLGGTKISAGIVCDAEVSQYCDRLLQKVDDAEAVLEIVIHTIEKLFHDEIQGIGIGVPSVVDRKRGIIYDVQNIPSWKEIELKPILESYFHRPVTIDNDSNCFALGERLYGKGRAYENFVGITIGTGLGAGIVNQGRLLTDANCGSGEFGEILYKDGRYEDYCGSLFFKNVHGVDGKEVFERAQKGDASAIRIFEEFGYHLGNAVKTIMFAVDPEAIIIGGSIAAAKDFFEEAMWNQIRTFTYSRSVDKLKIEYSGESKYAPILGAAAVCLDHLGQPG